MDEYVHCRMSRPLRESDLLAKLSVMRRRVWKSILAEGSGDGVLEKLLLPTEL